MSADGPLSISSAHPFVYYRGAMEQTRLPWELVGALAPSVPAVEARARIVHLQAAGLGPTQIARRLNVDGVMTPSGRGRWWPQTVNRHANPEQWNAYMRQYRRGQPPVLRPAP